MQFDDVDRKLLHALEVDGRVPFRRVGEVIGVSDQTVARRYRRLCERAGLRVVGVRDGVRLGQDQWMLSLRCAPDGADAIARALARRGDTAWIGLASGGTEVIVSTRVRSRGEHEELLLSKLPRTPSIVEIHAHQILHRFYGGPEGWLHKSDALGAEEVDALSPVRGTNGAAAIGAEDEALVVALEGDGRATLPELRRATGQSESAVRRRLERLLGTGAVYIDVEYDTEPVGYRHRAVLWITASPALLDQVGATMATHPEVAFAAAVAGRCNLVAVVVVRDVPDLYRYLSGPLGRLEGVERIDTSSVLRQIKQLRYEEGRR
ncbi:Lrp/AsnC family transcriptional regulator [Streptomyces boninensis]|uniref:Lrp/AsnC family transcriptional regulator n=1 Tax=Streptomyces boninensis TaxID=2039455 RepID=UPI003B21BC78